MSAMSPQSTLQNLAEATSEAVAHYWLTRQRKHDIVVMYTCDRRKNASHG
jgi:hypothetical protein